MWQLYDSLTGKGAFVQTPIKCVLFCPRYVIQEKRKGNFYKSTSSIICTQVIRNSDEWSKHHKTRNGRHRNLDSKNTVVLVIPWKLRMVRSLLDYLVQNIAWNSDKAKTTGCKVGFCIILGTVTLPFVFFFSSVKSISRLRRINLVSVYTRGYKTKEHTQY